MKYRLTREDGSAFLLIAGRTVDVEVLPSGEIQVTDMNTDDAEPKPHSYIYTEAETICLHKKLRILRLTGKL